MKRLAVIPARAGSKRIPNKNIKNFCGKPMIAHILSSARHSGLFSKIHVSTESHEIAGVVSNLGFAPDFLRPSSLADDHTPLMPVLRFVLENYSKTGEFYDEVWLLMACSPLIDENDLKLAASQYALNGKIRPMLAMAEFPVPIEWAYKKSANDIYKPVQAGMFSVRSQDISASYYDAGAFTIFDSPTVRQSIGAGSDEGFDAFILKKFKAIDIDNIDDWEFAEKLFRLKS